MNDKWGNGTIYYLRTNNFASKAKFIKTDVESSTTKIFKLADGDPTIIKTSQLAGIIDERAASIISDFVTHCQKHDGEEVHISYQDEHLKSVLSIVLCMQTIGYFVRKIGMPFSLEFLVERYCIDGGKRDNLGANQPTSEDRDTWLENMATELLDDIDIAGTLVPVVSAPRRSLTHWRVLTIECAGKRLCIYPDGGFMNGWLIYNAPGERRMYDLRQITYDTEIDICRNQEIKYDVTIEDC